MCGLLEIALLETDADRAALASEHAHLILTSLISSCTPTAPEASDALLLHSVYDLPKGNRVDEGSLWGDYFYLEALTRVSRPGWRGYR
ncbi:hypothetical protein GCM10009776_26630 [Microbacterium deminutum]|uniref:Uncharacterized protein n=1 Tax=Microbacterium deminutum TaxID=344164 RepID=A0ABN2R2R1_9MICO